MKKLVISPFLLWICMSVNAQGLTLESDWLTPKVGSTGQQFGAEVKGITNNANDKSLVIDISLPIEDALRFDTIEVLSAEQEAPLVQTKQHLWIEDYEKDSYGLRIFLKRNPRVGFRLRLIDLDGEKK